MEPREEPNYVEPADQLRYQSRETDVTLLRDLTQDVYDDHIILVHPMRLTYNLYSDSGPCLGVRI